MLPPTATRGTVTLPAEPESLDTKCFPLTNSEAAMIETYRELDRNEQERAFNAIADAEMRLRNPERAAMFSAVESFADWMNSVADGDSLAATLADFDLTPEMHNRYARALAALVALDAERKTYSSIVYREDTNQ